MATKPLIATHSNAHAVCPSARNLTDRQLEAIAETGGVVGLNFHVAFLRDDGAFNPDTPLETMVRHVDHLVEKLGPEDVAIGPDFDGCMVPNEIRPLREIRGIVGECRGAAAQRLRDPGRAAEKVGHIGKRRPQRQ